MADFKFSSTGLVGGSGQFYMRDHAGTSSTSFGAMKYKYFSHPGSTGTYTRSVNVISDFGLATQGGMLWWHAHNWPNDRSIGVVYWQNPGNADPLSSVGYHILHEYGVNITATKNTSVSHTIDFNVTNGHTNSHGHQFMVWGGR